MKQMKIKHLIPLVSGTPLIFMKWIDSPFIRNYEAINYMETSTNEQKNLIIKKYGECKIKEIKIGKNIMVNGFDEVESGLMIYFKEDN